MSNLSELFKMSKHERVGTWTILLVIVVMLAAVVVRRKCSSAVDIDSNNSRELNSFINEAATSLPHESKKDHKHNGDYSSNDNHRSSSHKKKGKKKGKKKAAKGSKSAPARNIDPIPQF